MDIKQLLTFKVAAECLNFSQTARQLNFAQSSVTAQIQALERETGKPLFERLGRSIKLTSSGRVFKSYADHVIQLTYEVEDKLTDPGVPAALTIGATESQCTYRLPPVLSCYKKHYPAAKMFIKPTSFADEIKEELVRGTVDLGLIMGDCPKIDSLHVEPLIKEKLCLVVSADHPLARTGAVSSEKLGKETLLLTAKGCAYRTLLEKALADHGIFPENLIEFVTVEAIKQCTLAGLGVAYLPAIAVHSDLQKGVLVEITWPYAPESVSTTLAWSKNKEITPNMRYFIENVRTSYAHPAVTSQP